MHLRKTSRCGPETLSLIMLTRLQSIYARYQRYFPAAFFILGFVFDIFTLGRIDAASTMIQLAVYLLLSAALIVFGILADRGAVVVPAWLLKVWMWRELAIQFLLGSLLSAYTLFYFKSSSVFSSFVFLAFIVVVMLLNEFFHFKKAKTFVRVCLLSVSVISFLNVLISVALSKIGLVPFVLSLLTSTLFFYAFHYLLRSKLSEAGRLLSREVRVPYLSMVVIFAALNYFNVIPPVPLALKELSIFHHVEKRGDQYLVSMSKPWYRFWESGDQQFEAAPGDKIFCFIQVFAPGGFEEELSVQWMKKNSRTAAWEERDRVPLLITGGRAEGYRGYVYKENYENGDWQIRVETSDRRELGRLSLTVVDSQFDRVLRVDAR